MSRKPKDKIKPQWMRWYEDSFQADVRVRYMKPMQRHLYRALIIQSFYCDTRPYLPDDDDMLWMLADADSKEHWMQHAETVRGMFKPTEVDGVKLLCHGKVLREWENTVKMYSGKPAERNQIARGTHGQPKPTRGRTKVGDNRTKEQTRTDRNRPETRGADTTLPDVRGAERSEGDPKLADRQTSRHQNQNTEAEQEGSASASGVSESASQSASAAAPPPVPQKRNSSDSGQSSGRDGHANGSSPGSGTPVGSGNPVTAKMQTFEDEEKTVTYGTTYADLVSRFWSIARKKPENGAFCGKPEADDEQWMGAIVRMHGTDKVKACLDMLARSDYWGACEKGRLTGIGGFQRALEAIWKQAQSYTEKVKATAAARRK